MQEKVPTDETSSETVTCWVCGDPEGEKPSPPVTETARKFQAAVERLRLATCGDCMRSHKPVGGVLSLHLKSFGTATTRGPRYGVAQVLYSEQGGVEMIYHLECCTSSADIVASDGYYMALLW